jgi:hypothetical protein
MTSAARRTPTARRVIGFRTSESAPPGKAAPGPDAVDVESSAAPVAAAPSSGRRRGPAAAFPGVGMGLGQGAGALRCRPSWRGAAWGCDGRPRPEVPGPGPRTPERVAGARAAGVDRDSFDCRLLP